MVGLRLLGVMAMTALGCGGGAGAPDAAPAGDAAPFVPGLGASFEPDGATLHVRVVSANATRLELWLYDEPLGAAETGRHRMSREPGTDVWSVAVPAPDGTVYYGLRAWGPNWPYDPAWEPGTEIGYVDDVDGAGNRFNPNKLLIDPYARELSHDPVTPEHLDGRVYLSGDGDRGRDSAPVAPKAIALRPADAVVDTGSRPGGDRRDHVIYEVHLRGLTRADTVDCAGTYAGAAGRAGYLADLGVTVVELLPVHETQNDANDVEVGTGGDNYWGYSTLAYFAPDRRYACDRSPGGPTREFRAMVRAFHDHGIEVWIDVVYNHTAEGGAGGGGTRSALYSLRGLDNATYYQLSEDGRGFTDYTGIGASVDATSTHVRNLVIDSLRYWHHDMGVDGFRFDLATVLANRCERGCFEFDPDDPEGILHRALAELPGADLVAEPWAIGAGTYQLGAFPAGWGQWNDRFRDTIRRRENRVGVEDVTPRELARRLAGSPDIFADQGPVDSVNYIVSHDGFTLNDVYACNDKNNGQPWPFGPSDGGDDHNLSWDHGGDPVRQRQAARTGLALLMLSTGPAMITGGDEMLRTQRCNNNPYNLDSTGTWLDWERLAEVSSFHTFVRRLIAYRRAHPELRRGPRVWYRPDGEPAGDAWLDDPGNQILAGRSGDHYLVHNAGTVEAVVYLPEPAAGRAWYRIADTAAWMEPQHNLHPPGDEYRMNGRRYDLAPRSLALFREQ